MTIAQMIQTSPAKANELFGKLADTSEGAVKTREKLFAELKEELELHARLEEQHLFPVLRKHRETKDLVTDAVNDNKQTRALLAELERLPKDSDDFPRKLTELRKVFQQHVRDERKELLPVVRKALSDEEAQAVADKLEAGRAKVEDAKREEAEQRRAEARQERAQAEASERTTRQAAAALTRPVETMVDTGTRATRTGTTILRAGADLAHEGTRRTAETVERTAKPALEQLESFSAAPAVAARAVSEAGEVWMEWAGRTSRTSVTTMQEITTCASPLHLALLQGRIVSEAMQAWIDLGTRLSQISMRASEEMMRAGRR
ncbi:hemerythrin domain-containing protein [Azospirillum sp. sgz301742]